MCVANKTPVQGQSGAVSKQAWFPGKFTMCKHLQKSFLGRHAGRLPRQRVRHLFHGQQGPACLLRCAFHILFSRTYVAHIVRPCMLECWREVIRVQFLKIGSKCLCILIIKAFFLSPRSATGNGNSLQRYMKFRLYSDEQCMKQYYRHSAKENWAPGPGCGHSMRLALTR